MGSIDQGYTRHEKATIDFSGAVVNEDTIKKVPNMVIKQVFLGTVLIYVSSDDNFGLTLESNINASNEFDAAVN